jgi:tetratricopeptide (TPR) repeat protein
MLGENALISGDIQYSINIQKELLADARRRRNPLHQGWGLLGIARNQIRLGNPAISVPMLQEALHILDETPNLASLIETNSQLALAYFRLGDNENAAAYARKTLELSENISPTVYSMNLGFAALADACFGLWETALHAQPETDPEQYKLLAEKALKPIRAFQGVFPIGQPVTPYYQGWYEWLTGKPEAALRSWHKGLDAAQKLSMPYEEGLIRVKLGACSKDDAQKDHFERAIQVFEKMGVIYELRLARSEAQKAGFKELA